MDASALTGAGVAAGVLLAATGFGLWRARRDGRPREVDAAAPAGTAGAVDPELLASLGVEPGGGVTLLQFSSAFCAPCRTTRVVCAEVAKALDGVRHVEVDAESHLAAVRELAVWRTPTVLVLDPTGRVVRRAVGAPTRGQVLAAVAAALPAEVEP